MQKKVKFEDEDSSVFFKNKEILDSILWGFTAELPSNTHIIDLTFFHF